MKSDIILPLHPEHAKARVFDLGIEGGEQAHRQDGAGVGGVDDAIIPEPGRVIERVRLFLEHVDRRLL